MKKLIIILLGIILTSCVSQKYTKTSHQLYRKPMNVGDKFIYSEYKDMKYSTIQTDTVTILGFNYNCINVQRGKTKFWIDQRFFRHNIIEVKENDCE